jgi:RNA polymerase sigma-B factor
VSNIDDRPPDERSRDLFERMPDDDARNELVELYRSLVSSLARRYQGYGEPLDDLIQVGSIGLLKAVDRFDPGRGVKFSTYATPTVVGELKRYFRDKGWSVRVPRRLQENALLLRDLVGDLSQEQGRSPTIEEIVERTGLSEDDVLEAMEALEAYSGVSLDAPVDDDADSATVLERIRVEDGSIELVEGWADLVPHLQGLPERERTILYLRFFRGWTQSRIADELDISQMHVSRLLAQTLRQLRRVLTEAGE